MPVLDNACGTIALLHALANAPTLAPAPPASPLAALVERCRGLDAEARGRALDADEGVRQLHR